MIVTVVWVFYPLTIKKITSVDPPMFKNIVSNNFDE